MLHDERPQPVPTRPGPPSQREASHSNLQEINEGKERAGDWWKARAWQLGSFLGDLSVGGWWLSGGRLSYWKMCKLVWMICFSIFVCVIVAAIVVRVVGETIGGIVFLLVAIAVGGVAVIGFVRSWVNFIRDRTKRRGSKERS